MYEDFRNYGLSEHTEIEIIKHQWRERERESCINASSMNTCSRVSP